MLNRYDVFGAIATEGHRADRLLRHHISPNERAFCANHLESSFRMPGRKGIVKLGEDSASEAHHAHDAVFETPRRHPLARGKRRHLGDLISEHKPEGIGIVNRDVENRATASVRPIYPPAPEMFREVDRVGNSDRERLSDVASGDHLPHRAVRGGIAQVMVRAERDARLAAGSDHLVGIVQREREWFLTEHVLASAGGSNRLVRVQLIGRADIDDVDVGIGEQRVDRTVRDPASKLTGKPRAPLWATAGDRDDLAIRLSGDGRSHPLAGNRA